jgi:hypothetical protein
LDCDLVVIGEVEFHSAATSAEHGVAPVASLAHGGGEAARKGACGSGEGRERGAESIGRKP